VFLCVMLWAWADKLLLFWMHRMGREFMLNSTFTCQLLTIPLGLSAMTGPTFFVTNGIGRPDINTKVSLFSALVNLPLCIYLIPRLGIIGSPIAMIIPVAGIVPFYVGYVNKKLIGLGSWEYTRSALMGPVIMGGLLFTLATFARPLITNLIYLIIGGNILLICYFALCYFSGIILEEERNLIRKTVTRWLNPGSEAQL
jgi:O-antigen/teichoic acid export membrane protein